MTLDREERQRRERMCYCLTCEEFHAPEPMFTHLREAHARIEELEEAYHAARQRCEELEDTANDYAFMMDAYAGLERRYEGTRRSAIILRDLALRAYSAQCREPGCRQPIKRPTYHIDSVTGLIVQHACWRHR